jgi:hypothetical protein
MSKFDAELQRRRLSGEPVEKDTEVVHGVHV